MSDSRRPDDKAEQAPSVGCDPENLPSPERRDFMKMAGSIGGVSLAAMFSLSSRGYSQDEPSSDPADVDPPVYFIVNGAATGAIDPDTGGVPTRLAVLNEVHDRVDEWCKSIDSGYTPADTRWTQSVVPGPGGIREAIFIGEINMDTGGQPASDLAAGFGQAMTDVLTHFGVAKPAPMDNPSRDESDADPRQAIGNFCRIWIDSHTRSSHTGEPTC